VDKGKHARVRVKPNPDFVHAKGFNLAAISLAELSACTANYPVVFVQNPDNQRFRPVVMFGLRPGENVFYDKDGWDTTYVPLMVQRHPFLIGFDDRDENSKTLTICLDKNSIFLSEDEGIPLFNEAGEETDYLKSRNMLLGETFEGEKMSEQFTLKLAALNLLTPFELILQPQNAELRKVAGMFTIDERKLGELNPEQLQDLHKLGFLAACYIILGSMFQVHRLMKLRNQKSGEVANYRIELPSQAAQG
jgi:hypothetical protein